METLTPIPKKTIYKILPKGTPFTIIRNSGTENTKANKDVTVQYLQRTMGQTYCILGKMTIRTTVALSMALFLVFTGSAFAQVPLTVQIAESQIGMGEMYGNNSGPVVERYTRGQDVAWCAAFVSFVRYQAGYRDVYYLNARSYWNHFRNNRIRVPKPGDFIVFTRGLHGGHIGIVEKTQGNFIWTIEGNVGRFPAKVKRFKYTMGYIKHLLGFLRIQ